MLSRIAEAMYWIGRYVERAEDTARITDVNYHHTLGMGVSTTDDLRRQRQWESLIAIVGDQQRFADAYGVASEQTVPPYLIFDAGNPNSVISCVARAREQAGALRHQIASEMWEALNRFHLELQQRRFVGEQPFSSHTTAHTFYRSVIEFSHLFQGVTDSTMPREEGWHFLQAGKFLERAEKTARALDVKVRLLMTEALMAEQGDWTGLTVPAPAVAQYVALQDVPGDPHQWLAVLRSMSAYEAYHKLYRSAVRPRSVIEMLAFSPVFPRSIRFSIGEVQGALSAIAASRVAESSSFGDIATVRLASYRVAEAERAVGWLDSQLAFANIDEVLSAGLHPYLLDLERRCYQIGEHIQRQYFAPRVLRAEELFA
ncbi:MAG: alpha-E domain-containing protein [Thermomicrobiales bacterium]